MTGKKELDPTLEPATLTDRLIRNQDTSAQALADRIMKRLREADDVDDAEELKLTDEEQEILDEQDLPEFIYIDWRGMPRPEREGHQGEHLDFIIINTRTGEQTNEYAPNEESPASGDPRGPTDPDGSHTPRPPTRSKESS